MLLFENHGTLDHALMWGIYIVIAYVLLGGCNTALPDESKPDPGDEANVGDDPDEDR